MPAIKPRTTQKHHVRHITRLYRENNETLFAYAKFIAEPTEYVVNQLIETVLARDRDFQAWRQQHPESHVPNKATRATAAARPALPARGGRNDTAVAPAASEP